MTRTHDQPAPTSVTDDRVEQFTGEVVYLYAFDLAYDMERKPIDRLLGQPLREFSVGTSKRAPWQSIYRPQMVRLPADERVGPQGAVKVERSIKLLPVGAISITVRMPFKCRTLEELVSFHDLRFSDGTALYDEVRALAEEVRKELLPMLIRPVERLAEEEAYTVFCINEQARCSRPGLSNGPALSLSNGPGLSLSNGHSEVSAEDWLLSNRRQVAALLTEERDPSHLSEQEATESTGRYFSYYEHDLVVVDWDAAIIVDEPQNFDETLHILELANLQLAELEAYDRILDAAVERSYRDMAGRRLRGRAATRVQGELREIRMDLARMSDELSNITKFFGDWHLARIYQALSARFHLADWHRTIDDKLKTLDDLYHLMSTERTNRWMLILEFSMALMFVIDVVLVVIGLRK